MARRPAILQPFKNYMGYRPMPSTFSTHPSLQYLSCSFFNWALEYFDAMAAGNERPALWVLRDF